MTNPTPPEIDPTYLTDNYPDYYCCRVIRSQDRLKDMVADALVSGTLDISHCIIDVEFNLPDLLKQCGQPEIEVEIAYKNGFKAKRESIECPFRLKANDTTFNEDGYFSNATFNQYATFQRAKFNKKGSFWHATFNEGGYFASALFNNEVSFKGATFDKNTSFSYATFNKRAPFQSTTFNGLADFWFTTFNDELDFKSTTFDKKSSFQSATFNKHASFQSTTFNGLADFWFTKFNESVAFGALPRIRKLNHEAKHEFATFNNDVDFRSVTFNGDAWFEQTVFMKKGHFFKSTFNKYAFFDGSTINNQVSFYETTFKQQAHFSNLTMHICDVTSEPTFFRLKIEDKFYFDLRDNCKIKIPINACIFANNGCFIIDYNKQNEELNQNWGLAINFMECDGDVVRFKIRNLSPESIAGINFKDCHFYGKNVAFTNVAMKHVSIKGGNTVKGMLFDHCDFKKTSLDPSEQDLLKSLFKFRSLAGEETFFQTKEIDPKKREAIFKERALVYASLKTTATEGGETQLANDFHFWQQYYQGKLQTPVLSWNWWYKISSAYGLSIGLPLAWHWLLVGIFSLVYCFLLSEPSSNPLLVHLPSFGVHATHITIYNQCCEFIDVFKSNLFKPFWHISLFSSIPFFGGKDTIILLYKDIYPDTLKECFWVWFGVQSLLQSFLAFQFGAAIRNKVKR